MKFIQEYAIEIAEELESAKEYAEKAMFWKYDGSPNKYKLFLEMANDEMKHAKYIHDIAVEDINKLKEQGYKAPEEMQEAWMETHSDYLEKAAWVKQILAM